MSTPAGDDGLLREVTRQVLAELLPGLLEQALTGAAAANGHGNGHAAPIGAAAAGAGAVPMVPAPPIAAVHRPPGWAPAAAEPAPAPAAPQAAPAAPARTGVEQVDLATDSDLDAFVRMLLRRFENPRDRAALRSGKLRFALRPGAAGAAAGPAPERPVIRIERGAAGERTVRQAAEQGARIVLAPGAVITPMGRDAARSLKVEIEKERRC